ncbi:PEP-CTERM sorting domain-containing protein [Glaciecola sp. XM2]|jgi:hypothetical protein|uniref:PEP-CTERM sorting domain-containing protein n=1 Tax=Glaciecola sp. XM2 TaxID=1914931 RepID=UPI001BDDD13A|nr:PEP-CTERM sorting domain-containing protein [Glaciecola sp. XM2]MBT1451157.1 PEP-CTERM sorting domain-containing protein [Glaciecola sp. XM2]
MLKNVILSAVITACMLFVGSANASLIYATSAPSVVVGTGQGTANDRDNINNLFGSTDGKFYELGLGGSVDLQFGMPTGQLFGGEGFVTEVTFGNPGNFLESADVYVGYQGIFTFVANIINTGAQTGAQFTFGAPFDTLRIVDTTANLNTRSIGGFDIDSVAVSPVPAPATVLLLGLVLVGLGARKIFK